MDLHRSYIFIVFIVMLIHEVVFSECDLKTKTHNRHIKSYVDEFQRKGRQAPIDPSRMYLPPSVDSVAAGGFGDGNVEASNNFGDNAADGYGEVALVQDPSAVTAGDVGYGVPAKTTDDGSQGGGNNGSGGGGGGGGGDDGPSSGQKPDRNNDFGRYLQPNKNGGSATGDELLNTAQNRGPTSDDRPGPGARQYGGDGVAGSSGYGTAGPSVPSTSSPQRDGDSRRDRAFSAQPAAGYGNAVPADPFGRESAAAPSYGQNANSPPAASYGQNGQNGNSPPAASVNGLQTSPQRVATYGGGGGGGGGNVGRDEWSGGYRGGYDRAETVGEAYGLPSSGGGFGSNEPLPSTPRGPDDNDGQNAATTGDGDYSYYGQTASSQDGFNRQSSGASYGPPAPPRSPENGGGGGGYDRQTSPGAGPDQSRRGTSPVNSYGPTTGSQLSPSGGNGYGQRTTADGRNGYGPTGSRASSPGSDGYGQNSPTYGGGYTRGSPSPTQASGRNDYAQIDTPRNTLPARSSGRGTAGSSSGSGRPCHTPGGENTGRKGLSGSSSTRSPTDSQNKKKHSTVVPKAQYQNSNSPSSGNLEKQETGLQNANNNGGFGEPSPNAFSNFAPGNQPNPPNDLNDNKGNYAEPGPNAFSNFAPDNQPNDLNDSKGNYGEPGPNAFSNFAPGNQPNDLNDSKGNYGEPGPNAFSNFSPGNQLSPPINSNENSNYGEPSSNFAPGNQLNPPVNLNDNNDFGEPGSNAFSNFAPGNQPNSPNLNNNNCGANNHGNNANAQYGSSVFSASNTGY